MRNKKEQPVSRDNKLPFFMTTAILTSFFVSLGFMPHPSESKEKIVPSEVPTPDITYQHPDSTEAQVIADVYLAEEEKTPVPYAAPYYVDGKRHD